MPDGIKYSVSCNDYLYNNATNTVLIGLDSKLTAGKFSAGVFNGVSLDSKSGAAMVVDLKAAYNYDKSGIVGQNLRLRNNLADGSISTQIRYSPCSVNVPVSKNTSIYMNPHGVAKYNYTTKKWDTGIGAFLGVTQKFKKGLSVSLEGQRYNIQNFKDNDGNWSANLILTKSF